MKSGKKYLNEDGDDDADVFEVFFFEFRFKIPIGSRHLFFHFEAEKDL